MRRLRFAFALVALALAGSTDSASAFGGCPSIISDGETVCAYTGIGTCDRCRYDCDGHITYFNMCGAD